MTKTVELPESPNEWQEINYPGLGIKIYASLNTAEDKIRENIESNCSRGLPQILPYKEQSTCLAICSGGPSLLESLDQIKQVQADGVKVVALANTGKVLQAAGIHVSAQVFLDARPNNASFVIDEPECKYFVASQCDPSVLDALEGKDVYLWHAWNTGKELEQVTKYYEYWVPVQGGNTLGLRSLRLFQILGYHKFDLYGFDSCYIGDRHHAYEQPEADNSETVYLQLNGKPFKVTAWMIQQAMEFMKMVKTFGQGWEVRVNGDGLIATMLKEA